jgi:transposase
MPIKDNKKTNRIYPVELKKEAVEMLQDGHSASSIVDRLGLSRTSLVYKWRDQLRGPATPETASTPAELKIRSLEAELLRVQRERDILKKALAILGRHE